MSAVLPAPLARSLQVAAGRAPVPLSVTTLGIIKDKLTKARLYAQEARLHARGNPEAIALIDAAGCPLRAALDEIEAAYKRGRL